MAKFCKICGCVIYGKARKYCDTCKREVHLNQMHDFYCRNTKDWQYMGKYWSQQSFGKCGTGSLGEHASNDHDKELKKVEKEMLNLGLKKRTK